MFNPETVPAYLRTAIPALWGSALVWLVSVATWLPEPIADLLATEAVYATVTGLAVLGWYALWRWLESKMPPWLTRIVLGSNSTPTYSPTSTK